MYTQGLVVLEGVLVAPTHIPVEFKHLLIAVGGSFKGECLLCLHGFLVGGGGWDCYDVTADQELLGLCLKMLTSHCGGDGKMARMVQDTDTPLF